MKSFGDGLLQLLHATPQGAWLLDARGITVDLNAAMCRLLGRPRDEVLGRAEQEFFRRRDPSGPADGTLAVARVHEAELLRPDGSVCPCIHHATPLFDEHGAFTGSLGLWTDLSAQQRDERVQHGYAFAFNSVSEAVSVVDPEMRYVLVNDAWCRITGIAREAAIGRLSTELLRPTSFLSDERREALERCLREGREGRVTSAHAGADGTLRHLETTHTPYRDAEGVLRGALLTTRDVTAERRSIALLQASEAQQRALLGAFPGFIGAVDEQFRYTYVNERLARLWGHQPHEVVGRTVREMHGPVYAELIEQEVRAAFAGSVSRSERHYPAVPRAAMPGRPASEPPRDRLDLEVLHVAGPAQPDGRRTCFVFGIDVTERQQAQDALRAARDEAEQANRAKSRFLAHMSHELRTPLHAISGFAQLLERDPRTPLTPAQAASVREIQHGAQHLLDLINEILDLGRIEAGGVPLELDEVPLPALVQECFALVHPLARERGVELREARFTAPGGAPGDAAWSVRADRMRLKQVLLNLLANAVKYNRAGGEVALTVEAPSAGEPGGAAPPALRISVQDTGPGIDEVLLERLFEPFERLGAERSGVEGTGIGLALSRRLVLAMGGLIGVESRVGSGTRFWIDLPAAGGAAQGAPQDGAAHEATGAAEATAGVAAGADARPAASSAAPTRAPTLSPTSGPTFPPTSPPASVLPAARPEAGPGGACVLYVDDNPVNLVLMEAMLALLPGLRLVCAATAAEGLRMAEQEGPSLILLDIQLPDIDGFEVLARLRAARADPTAASARGRLVPVVAVSANAMPADIEAARAAGFADYLTKPLDLERLHHTVKRLLATG